MIKIAERYNPLVSIIMPVYNAASYLREAIDSALGQSYSNIELLIINDGSTDDSELIINSYRDSRIQYLKQLNKGVSVARNAGLNAMKGEYFCFLDADDIYPHTSIESRLNVFFLGNDQLEFVDGLVYEYDERLDKVLRTYVPSFKGNPFNEMLKISETCYLGQTWLIKRRANEIYRMPENQTHGEDFFFLLGLCRSGGLYSFTNEPILFYRRHGQSAMSNLEGLNDAYLSICANLRGWPEVSRWKRYWFWLKSRKIMFLSYLFNGKSVSKALRALWQWA